MILLNLTAAVQIVCYKINKANSIKSANVGSNNSQIIQVAQVPEYANHQELESFYKKLESQLKSSGYINPNQPSSSMKKLRHLFNRAKPTSSDISMMRGVIKSLDQNK